MRWIRKTTEPRSGSRRNWLLVALTVAVWLLGCNRPLPDPPMGDHPDDDTPRRGGTLRLASFGDMRFLDPAVVGDALSFAAAEVVFAGLVDYDKDSNVVPDLASRYEVAEGGTVYRFFLREGVVFHDGTELTAEDVKRSIERALHPDTPGPVAFLFAPILGYDAYTAKKADHLEGVVVEGRYVVAIHLKESDSRFLYMLALPPLRPVCKSAGDRYSDTWAACGAGPFKVLPGGWDRGRSLTLVRHDGYFRPGRPFLDAVTWTFNMNRATEVYRFEDGDLDSTRDLSDGDVERFLRDPRWKPFYAFEADKSVTGEFMNTEIPPFDNVEVRRAVAAGINRWNYHLIKPVSLSPATQAIPPSVPGFDPTFRGQTYDYEAALEHMRRAGFPYDPTTDKGGYEPVIPYYAYPQGTNVYGAQFLQQELAKIGLRIDIRLVNFPTFIALAGRRKTTPMSAPGWQMDYADPSDFFDPIFGSDSISDENSTNYAFYKNPRLDEILTRARRELDRKARYALYGEANRIICDDAPEAFTFFFHFFVVSQPYVHDFGKHPVWTAYAADAWIDHDTKGRGPGGATAALGMNVLWPARGPRR
jgi:ABC-type transport system substrate-binding protein